MQAHALTRALLVQPKDDNFTPDSARKDWVIFPCVLSLRGLPLNEARSYFASTVYTYLIGLNVCYL
jgi:hypothetical protein